jgi:DNA-3-methyladenine glycosylase
MAGTGGPWHPVRRLTRRGTVWQTRPVTDLRALLAGPVDTAARALLGCELSAGGVTVRLTEVEAYAGTGDDPASHAHRGRTVRNSIMFGPPGFAYLYFTYGMHWCMNVVTGVEGVASAVLLRAGEVVAGLDVARARRPAGRPDVELARGPARLCASLGLDGGAYGADLLAVDGPGPHLRAPEKPVGADAIASGPRVGVTGAHEIPWRFWIAGDPTVSSYRRHVPKRRRAVGGG